jgi:hypothetical protein
MCSVKRKIPLTEPGKICSVKKKLSVEMEYPLCKNGISPVYK